VLDGPERDAGARGPGPEDPQPARLHREGHVDGDLRLDLHLYNGFLPLMEPGDILGHEFMGEVVEVGPA
jgi:hypothetical protein